MTPKLNLLARVIRQLVRELRSADPGSKLPAEALAVLRRVEADHKEEAT